MRVKESSMKLFALAAIMCVSLTMPVCAYECVNDDFTRCKVSAESWLTSTTDFQSGSGNPAIAVYEGSGVFENSGRMIGRLSLFGDAGGGSQNNQIIRVFDTPIAQTETSYTCSFDCYIDDNWSDPSSNRLEIHFAKDSDIMFVYDIRGDSHLFSAKRISDGQLFSKFAVSQLRPIGWNHIDIVVFPSAAGGMLAFYINGILMCDYADGDAFGLPGNFDAQFVDRLTFNVCINNQGPSSTPSVYIDNITVRSGAAPILGGNFDGLDGVDISDLGIMTSEWLFEQQCGLIGDLDKDCAVNVTDLAMFVSNWCQQ